MITGGLRSLAARSAVVLLALPLLAVACGDDTAPPDAAPSSTSSSTTPSPTTPPSPSSTVASTTVAPVGGPGIGVTADGACAGAGGSSPSTYDPAAGTYAATFTTVGADTVEFDVVQWLTGSAAADAYHVDFPDDPDGPPNDYYIVNENPATHSAALAADAEVWLVRLTEDSDADLDPGTVEELPAYVAASGDTAVYWLTVNDATVVSVCEQYRP